MMYIATDKNGNEYNLAEDQVEVWKRCGYQIREAETKEGNRQKNGQESRMTRGGDPT